MVKLQETKGRYFISIPKDMIAKKEWSKGQVLFFVFNERGNIEITDTI